MKTSDVILVVDDEFEIREILTLILEAEGYCVESASEGFEALRMLKAHRWSAVLVDRAMPGMSGDQLARSIRATHPKLPLILVSGNCNEGNGFAFDAVVPKPFTSQSIHEALHGLLGRGHSE